MSYARPNLPYLRHEFCLLRTENAPQWPPYTQKNLTNFVFDANVTGHLEVDNYRHEAIQYLVDKYRGRTYPWGAHDQS